MENPTEANKSYYFVIRISRIKHKGSNAEELELENLFWGKVSALDEIPKMIGEKINKIK